MIDQLSYWLERGSLYVALLAAWIAMLGSLYFSEVAGYIPCAFCWYQRILMYPLALILAVGLLRRDRSLPFYVLPLSILGIGFAIYHYLMQKTAFFRDLSTCEVGVPCTGIWINWFGFVTIPFLALIAFFVITMMTVIAWQSGELEEDDPALEDDVDAVSTTAFGNTMLPNWIPVMAVIAVVVVAFTILWQLSPSSVEAHDESGVTTFVELESGPQTPIDSTPAAHDSETAAQATDAAILAQGSRLYAETCAACHGAQAEGALGTSTALTTSELLQQGSDAEILAYIRAGEAANAPTNESGVAMPANGGRPDLSDEELLAIVRFVMSLE